MKGMRWSVMLVLGGALAGGCVHRQPSAFERALQAGDAQEMARLFDADSLLWRNEEALFHTAVARATPDGPVYDLERARTEMRVFLARFPQSTHRAEALSLDGLLSQLAELSARSGELSRRVDSLEARADSAAARTADQRRVSVQLQADLRRTQAELQSVQEELERLKAVDLRLAGRKHRNP